jgi:membrane protease YdiL (CAAX protease family)
MSVPASGDPRPWGRLATFGLGFIALFGSQAVALLALTAWYGAGITQLPDLAGNGVAVTLIIFVSIPLQLVLLYLLAQARGNDTIGYLGLTLPRRAELAFGIAVTIALIIVGNLATWLLGHFIITPFQTDIYRTASAAGFLPLLMLWLALVVLTPVGEEVLFRGFLFRGWLRAPRDAWPVILLTAFLWSIIHVQYDWFVIGQVFVFGVMLGFLRWATGSTILTIVLHALINCEGMLETLVSLHH